MKMFASSVFASVYFARIMKVHALPAANVKTFAKDRSRVMSSSVASLVITTSPPATSDVTAIVEPVSPVQSHFPSAEVSVTARAPDPTSFEVIPTKSS